MNIADMLNFLMCFPKCKLTKPDGGVQFLVDREGNLVGDVNWNTNVMSVYDDYKHCTEVVNQIEVMTGKSVEDLSHFRTVDP